MEEGSDVEDPEAGVEADKGIVDLLRNLLGRRDAATSTATAEKRLRLLPLALPPDAQAHAARILLWHLTAEGQGALVDDALLGSADSADQQARSHPPFRAISSAARAHSVRAMSGRAHVRRRRCCCGSGSGCRMTARRG